MQLSVTGHHIEITESLRNYVGSKLTKLERHFDNMTDVEKSFKDDMQRYGSNFGEDRQSYRNILEYLAKENEAISAREVAAKDELKEIKDRLLAVQDQSTKQIGQFEAQMKAAAPTCGSSSSKGRRRSS